MTQSAEKDAVAGEVWQEADNVLLLCVIPNRVWQDFNGQRVRWDAPTIARPLRRLLDRAGNLAPEYGKTRPVPPAACPDCGHQHTPNGCTGNPTPSDLWAGVSPAVCDCDSDIPPADGGSR